jgi:hypothetical protein
MSWRPRDDIADGFGWKCTKKGCTRKSARYNSFFEVSNLSIQIQLKLIYGWASHRSQTDLATELELTRQTIGNYYKYLRYITAKDYDKDNVILGGVGRIVEIDESLFVKVKHHKGKD